jgi:exosome complex exonuclease RRP6
MASLQTGSSMLSSTSFDEFNSNLQGAALKATKHTLSLPADLPFYRSVDSELSKDLDAFSARVLSVTNSLLNLVSTAESSQSGRRGKGKLTLENRDDVVDSFQSLVVDAMDQLLERAVSLFHVTRNFRLIE